MVQQEPGARTRPTLIEAGETLAKARHDHSEAFLRYQTLDPKRTDGVARAMADQDVDLATAEVDWIIAREMMAAQRASIWLDIVLAVGDDDATEPATPTH
jgi:hypothetical protein